MNQINNLLKRTSFLFIIFLMVSCSSQKSATQSKQNQKLSYQNSKAPSSNHDRTEEVESLDNTTYLLTKMTEDKTYGFTQENPVKVGGSKENSGPMNERRFLNALLGPNGEEVTYNRRGSCCPFSTPNGFMDGGLLDAYEVSYKGLKEKVTIYINMYDEGNLRIPLGFTAKK